MSKSKQKNIPVSQVPMKWQIKSIELLHMSMSIPQDFKLVQIFGFNIAIETKEDPEQKFVFVIVKVKIYDNDNPSIELGSISVSCIFHIENIDEIATIQENGIRKIPYNLFHLLISVSVSTTRGVIFGTYKGTPLHGATLPIVDPKGFQYTQNEADFPKSSI